MSRIYTYQRGLFWDYRRRVTEFKNRHFNNQDWLCNEFWCVYIRISSSWFKYWNMYYDGHTARSIEFCFIEIGMAYNYDSRPAEDWVDKFSTGPDGVKR